MGAGAARKDDACCDSAMTFRPPPHRRFDSATDVVGRTLRVERVPFTIIGVLPRNFTGPVSGRVSDVVIPVGMASVLNGPAFLDHAGVHWLTIMARLKRNQTLETASAALAGVQPQIRAASIADAGFS